MKCIFCQSKTKVIDKRTSPNEEIRRRRECLICKKRFTTYEKPESVSVMIIKKDGRREKFSKDKLLSGLTKAAEKRPISVMQITKIADEIEAKVRERKTEIESNLIGQMVMIRLKKLDPVAYLRYASVYMSFTDAKSFESEAKKLRTRNFK